MTEPTLVTDSAEGMAALFGAQVGADGKLTALPGTTPGVLPVTPDPAIANPTPVPDATNTSAEILALTGAEAVAKVNELLAQNAASAKELADAKAEAAHFKTQSRRNERAKREARKALADAGGTPDPDDTDDSNVHTDDQDDDNSSAASTLRQENMRLRAALKAGLDVSHADRLVGTTQAELEADAATFKALLAPSPRPQGRADGGAGVTLKVLTPQQEMAQLVGRALGS